MPNRYIALNADNAMTEVIPTNIGGAAAAGEIVALNGVGQLDSSMLGAEPVTWTAPQTFDGAMIIPLASPSTNNTPFVQTSDYFGDSIISGLSTSVPSPASLTGTLSSGICYVAGQRVYWPGGTYEAIANSQNCFIDMNADGTLNINTNTNGIPNTLRLYVLTTSATSILTVVLMAAQNVFAAHTEQLRYSPNPNTVYTVTPSGMSLNYLVTAFPSQNNFTINPSINGTNTIGIGVSASVGNGQGRIIGIGNNPLGGSSGWLTLGMYWQGWGIVGLANNSARPIFNCMNSTQTGFGIGQSNFTVNDTGQVYTLNNTLDDSQGNMIVSGAVSVTSNSTLTGTTSGSVEHTMPMNGYYKKFVAYASGYVNNTTTNQTITFPTAFTNTPVVTTNSSGLTLSASTTTLTITAPNTTTAYSGLIIVEGI